MLPIQKKKQQREKNSTKLVKERGGWERKDKYYPNHLHLIFSKILQYLLAEEVLALTVGLEPVKSSTRLITVRRRQQQVKGQ